MEIKSELCWNEEDWLEEKLEENKEDKYDEEKEELDKEKIMGRGRQGKRKRRSVCRWWTCTCRWRWWYDKRIITAGKKSAVSLT